MKALHTPELCTCIGKHLGKNKVPSRWEAHNQTIYSLTQNMRSKGRTNVRKEISRPRAPALSLVEPYPTASSQPLYFPPTEQSSAHCTSPAPSQEREGKLKETRLGLPNHGSMLYSQPPQELGLADLDACMEQGARAKLKLTEATPTRAHSPSYMPQSL